MFIILVYTAVCLMGDENKKERKAMVLNGKI
jgi:hypothetical protein